MNQSLAKHRKLYLQMPLDVTFALQSHTITSEQNWKVHKLIWWLRIYVWNYLIFTLELGQKRKFGRNNKERQKRVAKNQKA